MTRKQKRVISTLILFFLLVTIGVAIGSCIADRSKSFETTIFVGDDSDG